MSTPQSLAVVPPRRIEVRAPSRLHFGLFSFGVPGARQFGGVGAMIDSPFVQVAISPSDHWHATGPRSDRADEFARRWTAFYGRESPPSCRLEIVSAPREHIGLGLGTQLGLSVAAGLTAFLGWPQPAPEELAASVGRGQRSAVGTHGFAMGGLIAERGKLPHEWISPLDCRVEIPSVWRFVLVCPPGTAGLSGGAERQAFDRLPAVPDDVTEQLAREARDHLLPAAALGEFEAFSRSVYDFGRLAGLCFADQQGGPYNGPELMALVDRFRAIGVEGVGQSSWGPTIFGVVPDEATARDVAEQLTPGLRLGTEIWISPPNNVGRILRS